jgi:thiol-disulfide isomerase/thioredoxin
VALISDHWPQRQKRVRVLLVARDQVLNVACGKERMRATLALHQAVAVPGPIEDGCVADQCGSKLGSKDQRGGIAMKTDWLQLTVILAISILPAWVSAGKVPVVGDQLVAMHLDAPASLDHRSYLGLSAEARFSPIDISGSLLIIEIFSMYCPHCQREAPAVNRLYQAIQASQSLRNRVKMIGIGVGNSTFEVDHFRKHYQIGFPLFPDEDFVIHQALGEVRTPFFIVAAIGSKDAGKVLWTGSGNMDPLETFISRLNNLLADR